MDLHDLYRPFLRHFRPKRMDLFVSMLGITSDTTVLDVGASQLIWESAPVQPQIIYLNSTLPEHDWDATPQARRRWVVADARRLPFKDEQFDVVFSNSVIEHLGDIEGQRQLASEVQRVGRSYFIQTPNRYFLVEPHLLTPLIHLLPKRWRRRLLRNFTIWGWVTRPSPAECESFINEVNLLDRREFSGLFPGAIIVVERFLLMAKSLIAVGRSRPDN